MKLAFAVVAVLVASATSALADPTMTTSPIPPSRLDDGSTFNGHSLDFAYSTSEGDTPVLRMHGFPGIQLVGLPDFLREVPTGDGRLLRGAPQPGTYVVEMYQDGVRIPTLDMTMRFIPR